MNQVGDEKGIEVDVPRTQTLSNGKLLVVAFRCFLVAPEASTGAIGVCLMIGASSGGCETTKFCLK